MNTKELISVENWSDFCSVVRNRSNHLPDQYKKRIEFELFEANKQGLNGLWIDYYKDQVKFPSNPNNLLIPWVLGMLVEPIDPMSNRKSELLNTTDYSAVNKYIDAHGDIPHDFQKDADVPDIDIDCLPEARDPIKEYAAIKYGKDDSLENLQVCSVGTWQTYKFKMAIQDAASATGAVYRNETKRITADLPEDLDQLKPGGFGKCKGIIKLEDGTSKECGFKHRKIECPECGHEITDAPTLDKLINEFEPLKEFYEKYPEVIEYAARMVGRIRNMGMHAGALIIANKPLLGSIPLAKNSKDANFVTMWSEGSNQQLSKCGYIKWDILGLKTLGYIHDSCHMIYQNRGLKFGLPQKVYRFCLKDGSELVFKHGDVIETKSGPVKAEKLYESINKQS